MPNIYSSEKLRVIAENGDIYELTPVQSSSVAINEASDVATTAIEKEEYFIWKGQSCKALTDIAVGDTIVLETNARLLNRGFANQIANTCARSNESLVESGKGIIYAVDSRVPTMALVFATTGAGGSYFLYLYYNGNVKQLIGNGSNITCAINSGNSHEILIRNNASGNVYTGIIATQGNVASRIVS